MKIVAVQLEGTARNSQSRKHDAPKRKTETADAYEARMGANASFSVTSRQTKPLKSGLDVARAAIAAARRRAPRCFATRLNSTQRSFDLK